MLKLPYLLPELRIHGAWCSRFSSATKLQHSMNCAVHYKVAQYTTSCLDVSDSILAMAS